MTHDVLLLNADYSPVRVVDWRRAVSLLLDEKVQLVAGYEGRQIRSPSATLPWPAVVTLRQYARHRGKVCFSRQNVLARDGWACQYCGESPRSRSGRPLPSLLTMDHVVPRARSEGGQVVLPWSGRPVPVTSWENIVTACRPCNQRKAAKLPEEAKMVLRTRPRRPTPWEGVRLLFSRVAIPEEWKDYLPEAAA